jgi:bifunctional non-homologous end joining protein LigD
MPTFACARCRDAKWVCELHPDQPSPHGACGAAAMPCPNCQPPDARPDLGPDWESFARVDDADDE